MVDVDVGMRHSCALGADGTVHCWGKNREGQLGDDSFVDSPFPVQVAELTDATAIAAGGLHTCAITGRQSESRVYCWGLNDRNQVGVSIGDETRVPVQVAANGLPLIGYTDIGIGIGHTCAMGPSRDPGIQTVMCWGSNRSGQLGIGSSEVKITVPQRIVRQTSDNNAIWDFVAGSLAVGTSSTCASRDGGSVWCWGSGRPGHFGSEELSDFQYSAVEHPGLSDARRLWHGSHHVCAERASGRVVCWGNNGRLAFDDESTVHYNPVVLHDVVEPNDVAPGSDFTCWADGDGRAFCQGASEYGQLGDPSLIEVTAEPQRVYPEWSAP
jgi:alpha-tubulin suppressor-like RCC1 family protein